MTRRPVPRRLVGAGAVTAGAMVANVAAYLLHLPASRWLGPGEYGAFAALVSVQLLVAVPSLALQAVVAREAVHGVDPRSLRGLGSRVSLLVAAVGALLAWPVAALLDTPVSATAAALASGPLLCLLATEQGLLQGRERFGLLGLALALAGVGKVAPAVVVLAAGGGTPAALAAGAAGVGLSWIVVRAVAARSAHGPRGDRIPPTVVHVLAAGQIQLVVMALTSVDLLLARTLLSPADAGRYALGAIAAKAAFWLPQAVGTVLYPRMAAPDGWTAVRAAVGVVSAIGVLVVGGIALVSPLAPAVAGEGYRPVVGLLWGFAALGVVCSVLQALLVAAIARDRTVDGALAWVGLVVVVAAVWLAPRTVGAVLAATTGVVAVTTLAVAVRTVRTRAYRSAP